MSNAEWYCRRDPKEERFYEIFFGICQQYRISWTLVTETERAFVEEVARGAYEHNQARSGDLPLEEIKSAVAF